MFLIDIKNQVSDNESIMLDNLGLFTLFVFERGKILIYICLNKLNWLLV